MKPTRETITRVDHVLHRKGLLIALAVILSLAFLGTSLLNYVLTRTVIRQEILQKHLPLTRDNIYSDLTAELMRPILVASSMASDAFLQEWALDGEQEPERMRRYLRLIHDRYGFFSTFFVSAKTLNYYHFKGIHKQISPNDGHDVWFYRFVDSDKEYDLDVDTDEVSQNSLTVFINYKVFDADTNLLGVAGVGLRVDALAEIIEDYQVQYERGVYLADTAGVIQVHQEKGLIEQKTIMQLPGMADIAPEILATRDNSANYRFTRDGQQFLVTVRYIDAIDWLLLVEQNETKALTQARMNMMHTLLIGVFASLCIIGLTLVTINRYQKRMEDLATTDALTGVANRRVLEHEFERFVYLSNRSQQQFAIILIDLDNFKQVNDQLGHLIGDFVLKQVAGLIRMTLRPTDIIARWGGDEFVVLTAVSRVELMRVAERLRAAVAESELFEHNAPADDPRRSVTICCGITNFQAGDTLDAMLQRADAAMYQGKRAGGNSLVSADF